MREKERERHTNSIYVHFAKKQQLSFTPAGGWHGMDLFYCVVKLFTLSALAVTVKSVFYSSSSSIISCSNVTFIVSTITCIAVTIPTYIIQFG